VIFFFPIFSLFLKDFIYSFPFGVTGRPLASPRDAFAWWAFRFLAFSPGGLISGSPAQIVTRGGRFLGRRRRWRLWLWRVARRRRRAPARASRWMHFSGSASKGEVTHHKQQWLGTTGAGDPAPVLQGFSTWSWPCRLARTLFDEMPRPENPAKQQEFSACRQQQLTLWQLATLTRVWAYSRFD